jgi:hypothetical protein
VLVPPPLDDAPPSSESALDPSSEPPQAGTAAAAIQHEHTPHKKGLSVIAWVVPVDPVDQAAAGGSRRGD